MIEGQNQNGWNEYSKLVLKELERLNDGMESLRDDIDNLNQSLIKNDNEPLKKWKGNVDEVFSPSQMKQLRDDVDSLKIFRTASITIFAVIQFLMALAVAISKYI